ncbi:MAG TPA: PEP-CTERM sorting domain-containing protein [Planctomycetota bacterium]|nr:PEP-CTERM sorting domain-containing protein [Planctomycetota bacterium]
MRGACLLALGLLLAAGIAGAGVITFGPALSTDASTGIGPLVFYTHKIAGGEAQAVNGVSLAPLTTSVTPPNFNWNTHSWTKNVVTNNPGPSWNPGTGGVTGPDLIQLLRDFTYSGNGDYPPRYQTFTLTGLTPEKTYDLRLYIRLWNNSGDAADWGRPIDLTFTNGAESDTQLLWEDRPTNHGYTTDHAAYYLNYRYTALTSSLVIDAVVADPFTDPDKRSGSLHLYGLTNQLVPEPPAGPEVIYREVFGNNTGDNQAPSYAGWSEHYGSGATVLTTSVGVSGLDGCPDNLPAINSFPASAEQVNGLFSDYNGSPGNSARIMWTNEVPIDLSVFGLVQAQWYQGNADARDALRVAVQLDDGQWYASALSFTNPGIAGSDFDTAAQLKTFDFEDAEWRLLNFTPGSLLQFVGSGNPFGLPGGSFLTSFGLFSETRLGNLRFDSFELIVGPAFVIPEPGSVALLGLGLAALARRRSRRRRGRGAVARRGA